MACPVRYPCELSKGTSKVRCPRSVTRSRRSSYLYSQPMSAGLDAAFVQLQCNLGHKRREFNNATRILPYPDRLMPQHRPFDTDPSPYPRLHQIPLTQFDYVLARFSA